MTGSDVTVPAMTAGTTLSPEDNLSRYLREIQKFPILEREEEFELARALRDNGDLKAAHKLVTSHLRLVAKTARGYGGYGMPMADLISEGNIGMMTAVRKFDPDMEFRLATYAMWWIKAQIHEYILRTWSLVKMGTTAAQKKLFFNLKRVKKDMSALGEGDLDPQQVTRIADELNVKESEVILMNRRMAGSDSSLNAPVGRDSEAGAEWQDWIEDKSESHEAVFDDQEEYSARRKLMLDAMSILSEREREILTARRLKEDQSTLEELSIKFDVSRERVRQIEVRAFEKLQEAVRDKAIEMKLLPADDDGTVAASPAS